MLDGTWDLLFLMWRWGRWGRFHQYGEHHKHLNQSGYVWTNLWTSLGFKHVLYVWESVKGHSWCVWSFGGKSLEGSDQEKRESFVSAPMKYAWAFSVRATGRNSVSMIQDLSEMLGAQTSLLWTSDAKAWDGVGGQEHWLPCTSVTLHFLDVFLAQLWLTGSSKRG